MMERSDIMTVQKRPPQGWRRRILYTAVLAALPALGCAENVKQSNQLGAWSAADRPVVLSGSPARDSLANTAADEQLSEADWKLLESMGPKAIWERIAEMNNKSARPPRQASTQ